jgi:uncharacterized membrane protein YraQ (UPF0718 family)
VDWKHEWKPLVAFAGAFLALYYLPLGVPRFDSAVMEALHLSKWYAQEHVLLCLVPAFFIAGAVAVFISQASVIKYLGANAPKALAYGVASVSGTIMAVCSCTILPLFAGIYRIGAGLGPAVAFLYSGPAINVLAIILTARVLGLELGIARAVGAILFSIVIGLLMHLIFRKDEAARLSAQAQVPVAETPRPLWQTAVYFASMIGILVFANWGAPQEPLGLWASIFQAKWAITAVCAAILGGALLAWFGFRWWELAIIATPVALLVAVFPHRPLIPFVVGLVALSVVTARSQEETRQWFNETWGFAKKILPLLFWGVLVAGLLLGRPGHEGLIPSVWVSQAVGGNSLSANLLASVAGAFMYFATLTEVPILQGLIGAGMGKGPALALLLAGPALSLPNMLVIRSVIGTKKTFTYVVLVVVMATVSGVIYGAIGI